MSNLIYPIYKLPEEFMQDYEKRELPRYMKYWLYLKSKIKKSIIKEGSSFDLNGTVNKKFIKLEIEGKTEQEQYSGKNLLNIADLDETVQGLRFRGNDKNELIISGTYTGSTNYVSFNYKNINLPADAYTFTADSNNQPSGLNLRLWTRPTNLNLINGMNGTTSEVLTAFTFALIGISNNTNYNITYKIQLEKGSSKTSFEPYCGGIPSPSPEFPQPIKNVTGDANDKIQNKNLVDGNKTINQYVNSQGVFINSDYDLRSDYIKVENNKNYILSAYDSSFNRINRLYQVAFYDKNKTFLSRATIDYNNTFIVTETNVKYVIVWQGVTTSQTPAQYLQVEYGTTATSYVPHQEQNYPFTFSEGQRLYKYEKLTDNGKEEIWEEYIFTGEENWLNYPNTQTGNYYRYYSIDVKLGRTNYYEEEAFCTHFRNNNFIIDSQGIALTKNATYISIDKTIASSTEELKQWFATQYNNGNPVKVQFIKSNPTIIPYTSLQQEQYQAIKNARTYKDKTYITTGSSELPPKLKIQYWEEKQNTLNTNFINPITIKENESEVKLETFENEIIKESEEMQNEENN